MSAPQWLTTLGIPEECISNSSSAQEKGRRFSIRPRRSNQIDEIWRIQVDGCWMQDDVKRVDYLFWGQSATGQRVVMLVELKGKNFGRALEQIERTLQRLCRRSDGNIIHTEAHLDSPGHDPPESGGMRAYVVLSKGSGVPQRLRERQLIQERYGVVVYPHEPRPPVNGLDALLR